MNLKPLFDPSVGVKDITERYIYSTGMVGIGAKGEMRLFTLPRGHPMPALGDCVSSPQTDAHTNIVMVGQLGSMFGDAALNGIRVYTQDLGAGVDARLSIVVAGKVQFETPLAPLLAKMDFRPLKFPILVARTDTIEARVTFDKETTSNDVPCGHALLRVELSGGFAQDVLR